MTPGNAEADFPENPFGPTPSRSERIERGHAARARVPFDSWADLALEVHRADPLEILRLQDRERLRELVPLRWERMLQDPFTLYRGAAAVMASDLARTPVTGIKVQVCGDAHIGNFGLFAAPDRSMVFDLNDFDETMPGPWEWDLRRLCASAAIAGRAGGLSRKQQAAGAAAAASAYRSAIAMAADVDNLTLWFHRADAASVRGALPKSSRETFDGITRKARKKSGARAIRKLTEVADGRRRFVRRESSMVPIGAYLGRRSEKKIRSQVHELLSTYYASVPVDVRQLLEQYQPIDIALKVVGVGSVGMRNYVVLLAGTAPDDFLMIQVKEATSSVLGPYLPESGLGHAGARVVKGQRLLQSAGDPLLGWGSTNGHDFYLRQLWDIKGSIPLNKARPKSLRTLSRLCGAILGRAHARTGDRVALAAYLQGGSELDRALGSYSVAYADLVDEDYSGLTTSVGGLPSGHESKVSKERR